MKKIIVLLILGMFIFTSCSSNAEVTGEAHDMVFISVSVFATYDFLNGKIDEAREFDNLRDWWIGESTSYSIGIDEYSSMMLVLGGLESNEHTEALKTSMLRWLVQEGRYYSCQYDNMVTVHQLVSGQV